MIREQRFASNTAHEFRTPLTGIKTHLQVARRIDGEQQQLALARAETGVLRLQNVAEQLLMLARLESRDDWREFEPCAVSIAIREALVDMPGRTSKTESGNRGRFRERATPLGGYRGKEPA